MSTEPRSTNEPRTGRELRTLLQYFIITSASNGIGLALRYLLIACGVNHNLAYTAYYVSSVIVFYLCKWVISRSRDTRSFIPRFLGYCVLNVVSVLIGNLMLSCLLGCGFSGEPAFWLTCPITFLINYLGGRLVVFKDFDDRSAARNKKHNPEGD